MKRAFFIIILAVICSLVSMAQDRPDITHQSTGRDRIETKSLSSPTLTYYSMYRLILVNGNGLSDFYNVMINNAMTNEIVYYAAISGDNDVIEASMLIAGMAYDIILTDENGTTFTYVFDGGDIYYTGHMVGKIRPGSIINMTWDTW